MDRRCNGIHRDRRIASLYEERRKLYSQWEVISDRDGAEDCTAQVTLEQQMDALTQQMLEGGCPHNVFTVVPYYRFDDLPINNYQCIYCYRMCGELPANSIVQAEEAQ